MSAVTDQQSRRGQLEQLEVAIERLLEHLPPQHPMRSRFESARESAASLRSREHLGDTELSELSTTLTALFDPKDAGLIWPPARSHEEFEARSAVFECALDLRVIGY